jgi:hypothetical protein
LESDACIVDVVKAVDREISKRTTAFPVRGHSSLLQMTFHPFEKRFYKQVAIQAYERPGVFLDVRENPSKSLPDGATVVLIPQGPCREESPCSSRGYPHRPLAAVEVDRGIRDLSSSARSLGGIRQL